MLAQVLASAHGPPAERVQLNLCLFDPVPGNLVTTARYLDVLSVTTANKIIDVRANHSPSARQMRATITIHVRGIYCG